MIIASLCLEEGAACAHLESMRTVDAAPDLFAPPPLPPGLEYRPDFLDRDAEATLMKLSDMVASSYFTTRERSEAPWEAHG